MTENEALEIGYKFFVEKFGKLKKTEHIIKEEVIDRKTFYIVRLEGETRKKEEIVDEWGMKCYVDKRTKKASLPGGLQVDEILKRLETK